MSACVDILLKDLRVGDRVLAWRHRMFPDLPSSWSPDGFDVIEMYGELQWAWRDGFDGVTAPHGFYLEALGDDSIARVRLPRGGEPAVDIAHYPHTCPQCTAPAWVSPVGVQVDCSRKCR